MKLTKQQELVVRFNWWSRKLNQLDGGDGNEGMYDLVPRNDNTIMQDDVDYMKNHYDEMVELYKELKLGIYA